MIYEHYDTDSFWGTTIQTAMEIRNRLNSTMFLRFVKRKDYNARYEVLIKSIGEMLGQKHPTAKTWVAKPNPFRDGVLVEIRE